MSAEEAAAFEARMARDPALAGEVARLRQLIDDLEAAELSNRVAEALAGLPADPPKGNRLSWWFVLTLAGLLAVSSWFFLNRPDRPLPDAAPSPADTTPGVLPGMEEPPGETAPAPPPPAPEAPSSNQLIAENQVEPAAPSHSPAPRLRGGGPTADSSRQLLLNAVWYTEYPPADLQVGGQFRPVDELLRQRELSRSYALLQVLERKNPANDTLFFLKGYCLLERGEGGEALTYFQKVRNPAAFGTELLEWYAGLSLLLSGDDAGARKAFEGISSKPAHPYRQRATSALQQMR